MLFEGHTDPSYFFSHFLLDQGFYNIYKVSVQFEIVMKPIRIFSVCLIKCTCGFISHVLKYRFLIFYSQTWICRTTSKESIAGNLGQLVSQLFVPHPILYNYVYFLNGVPIFGLKDLFLPPARV